MGAPLTRAGSESTVSPDTQSIYGNQDGGRPRDDQPAAATAAATAAAAAAGFQTGVLKKRKRKRHQGYARRYFSLDFTSSTLSYYLNRESSALRGAIPLSLAAISASKKERAICIDSGAEVWHLRANDDRDWEVWRTALERAAQNAAKAAGSHRPPPDHSHHPGVPDDHQHMLMEERGWAGVEALVGRVAGVRDAVRRLAMQAAESPTLGGGSDAASSSTSVGSVESSEKPSKIQFWKRKPSVAPPPTSAPAASALAPPRAGGGHRKKSVGAAAAMLGTQAAGVGVATAAGAGVGVGVGGGAGPSSPQGRQQRQQDISFNLRALLADLDSVVSDFSGLIAQNKQRRRLHHRASAQVAALGNAGPSSRLSMDSTASDEFFDAEDAPEGVVMLNNDGDEDEHRQVGKGKGIGRGRVGDGDRDGDGNGDGDEEGGASGGGEGADEGARSATEENEATDDSESDPEDDDSFNKAPQAAPGRLDPAAQAAQVAAQSGQARDLTPLPLDPVPRRQTVPEAKMLPPSLIGFLRKNVGKDLSTIAMPVSANEPISLLQRLSEQLEYSELLDRAADAPADTGERILHIAAFAISSFSAARIKERAIRKPFNPMLGETFELVREDKGFRFLSEKVSHRPVIMACHADASRWTFSQSPQPTQKFWGKSAELITSGRVRIYLPATNDRFSYTVATSFLRNIIAGEKYVEPTGSMHIHNETTGEKAVVTFKQNKGMFSGRSEDVAVQAFDAHGNSYPASLLGKWTEQLLLVGDLSSPSSSSSSSSSQQQQQQRVIWRVGAVVDGAPSRYGFTQFAAQLNEITPIEEGRLPPTDSRLRPDQRMVEDGQLDEAETAKQRLEEAQRARRREMEESGVGWTPRWFRKVREYADEEVWRIVDGGDGGGGDGNQGGVDYWTARLQQQQQGGWSNVQRLFE